ncbi:endonuclease domain-containing protein [Acidithiobacillus acidisediminis]|uniref:endonuclease domain-containing protein n=1 Tax=Acidithiobacillus acidisediminis TaxID=2937799 RepID=UPI00200C4A9F|nr:DUF559 domain-containing protein [Acidithiobacillus sp. S30A2]
MGRITLQHLPPALRAQVRAEHGLVRERKTAGEKSVSPFAERLGRALEDRFPGLVQREYRPLEDRRYRIDFAFPQSMLAIEFDGYRHHGFSREGFRQGLARQNALVLAGWRVLRYTLTDVRDRMDGILADIEKVLRTAGLVP